MTQGWYATTVPPCCPSCHHMIWPSLTRDHRDFGKMRVVASQATGYSLTLICHAQIVTQTCKTPIISNVQKCLPGSEKSESSSAKFAAPSPLPEPRASACPSASVGGGLDRRRAPRRRRHFLQRTAARVRVENSGGGLQSPN